MKRDENMQKNRLSVSGSKKLTYSKLGKKIIVRGENVTGSRTNLKIPGVQAVVPSGDKKLYAGGGGYHVYNIDLDLTWRNQGAVAEVGYI